MHKYLNPENKIIYPESYFSVDYHKKYRKINEKIANLNKDFQILLNNKIRKETRIKKNYYSFGISKLFRKLILDSTNKLKSNKNNFEQNKKFIISKPIKNHKDKKIMLLKLIRSKKINENKNNKSSSDKNSFNNISSINNITNSFITGKEYNNNSYDNKLSLFTNRSINYN